MSYTMFVKPSQAAAVAAAENPMEKRHCSWKAACRAEDAGLSTVRAKPHAPMGSTDHMGLGCAEEQEAVGSAGTQPAG